MNKRNYRHRCTTYRNLLWGYMAPDAQWQTNQGCTCVASDSTADCLFLLMSRARSSRVFLVYYNNEDAMAKVYISDLHVQGEAPGSSDEKWSHFGGFTSENQVTSTRYAPKRNPSSRYTIVKNQTGPFIGILKFIHRQGLGLTASDWDPPQNINSYTGPVMALSEVWGTCVKIPEVDASVSMSYPG